MFKNLSIKVKIIILSILAFLGLVTSISFIAINKVEDIEINDKMRQLQAINVAKYSEIKNSLQNIKGLLTSLAQNYGTIEAFVALNKGFYNLHKEINLNIKEVKELLKADFEANYLSLVNYNVPNSPKRRPVAEYLPRTSDSLIAQYIFITDNPAPVGKKNSLTYNPKYKSSYMEAHKKYHLQFNKFLNSFGLYDIFLVNLKGDVIYTDFKEKDFATNLYDGPYAQTGLAKVFKKSLNLNEGEISFEDFAPYEPSYNAAASFIATPIFFDGNRIATLIFQMPIDKINNIMKFDGLYKEVGLGNSGDCFLVGENYKMRTNSRFYKSIDNDIVQQLQSTIDIVTVRTASTEAVLKNGKVEGSWIIKNNYGKDVLSAYHALNIFDQAKWVLISEIDKSEVLEPVSELKKEILKISMIILIFFILMYLFFANRLIIKPLKKFQDGLLHFFEFLNGKRKDIKLLEVNTDDEIGKMAQFVNTSIEITKKTLQQKEEDLWIREGIRELNSKLVGTTSELDVCSKSIKYICEYLNAGVGVVYVYDEEKEELNEFASYAYVKRDFFRSSYKLGEGIVGQVALQKSPIMLSKVDNIVIESATVSSPPSSTYTFPLIFQNRVFGVIEIGMFREFFNKEIEFLETSGETIATSLSVTIQNRKVQKLLEDTQKANEKLKVQQESLERANAQMEEQQQQLEQANAQMEEQQQQLEEVNTNLEEQKRELEISQQKLKEQFEALKKAKEEIELSNKYKSEFLANMSHELRTPLNSIILLSQLLAKNSNKNLNEDDVKKAKTIFTSGNELLRLINDILDLSKVESGKMEVVVDSFDSSEFLEETKNLFEHSAEEKGLELKIIDEYKGIIFSDKNKVSQIIRNLISNSLKFTSDGFIEIKIAKSEDKTKPIEISVTDTGIGIPKDKLDKIFKAFVQADGSTSRKYGGTGLGLSISKNLVHLLGGEIFVESKEDEGSKFVVRLPNLKKREIILENSKDFDTIEINDDRNILGDNSAILIIDDDETFAGLIYETVKKHGHYGLIAYTGKDGLKLLHKYKVSGIVLDLGLPDIDGIDLLREIKNDDKLKDIPIHVVSSNDKDDKFLKMGAIGYEQKPLLEENINEVIEKLEEFINEVDDNKLENSNDTSEKNIDLNGLNILVVDDDIKNIFVLDSALREYNANIITAYNGKEALEKLNNSDNIDIILMDIMMPVMNGYEAIEIIRKELKLDLPIIAVTAKAMKEDREKAIGIGADDFVSKPIDIEALIKIIKVWSEKKNR